MGTQRAGSWVRRLGAGVLAAMLAAMVLATPAHASLGGSAEATGMRGQAPEVRLEVSANGAISAVQPILDRLTRDPILSGRQEVAAQVATPEPPSGTESRTQPERRIPGLVTVEEISAGTERIQDGELSAQARTGEVHVGLLGLDVLRVGGVHAEASTHPTEEPTASAGEPSVHFFGRQVPLPVDEPVDIDQYLSTADALEALETALPGLTTLVQTLGGVFEAGGGVQVRMGRTEQADAATGSAAAVGFYAAVHLELDARICIPNLSGDCLAEVTIRTDATVLDLVLAETAVERPEMLPVIERIDWTLVVPLTAAVALVLFGLGLGLGRWRRRQRRPGSQQPGSGGADPGGQPESPAQRIGRR
ncbi:hypothetical protein ACO0LV_10760 [Pseudactinotalea sp. Z1739]|uniref:hypothetical protein n=1 Tax=Pseudactinotalea sp. Z1739 TaxID=3413028 RepID=UPI003C799B3E